MDNMDIVENTPYNKSNRLFKENTYLRVEGALESLIVQLITGLGEDINREGLQKTPNRVEKALLYLTNGYEKKLDIVINNALFKAEGSEMVIVKDIEFYSLCEHHMLPFFGKAHYCLYSL